MFAFALHASRGNVEHIHHTMRRAQSVRHYARPSLALAADDLGMLREGDESNEDVLRKQLLDKDRENDKARSFSSCFRNARL